MTACWRGKSRSMEWRYNLRISSGRLSGGAGGISSEQGVYDMEAAAEERAS
jgi:hypothetical protein